MKAVYVVEVWEHERGWGSRLDFEKSFESFKEAMTYVDEFNSKNTETVVPDWYMVAHSPKLVDLDKI